MSSLSITRYRAVTPDEIGNEHALPDTTHLTPPEIACWRSHVNAWRHIVESGIETALILEDDVDWHINVKRQFALLSEGLLSNGSPVTLRNESLRAAEKRDDVKPDSAPYGLDWELLMIGQQWNERDPNEPRRPGFTYADTTIRTYGTQHDSFVDEMKVYGADPAQRPNTPMRVVAKSSGFIGTTAYAVTRRGAEKLLYRIGIVPNDAPIDHQMSKLSSSEDLAAIRVTPPFFYPWKTGEMLDTDIQPKPFINVGEVGEGSVRKEMRVVWGLEGSIG